MIENVKHLSEIIIDISPSNLTLLISFLKKKKPSHYTRMIVINKELRVITAKKHPTFSGLVYMQTYHADFHHIMHIEQTL